MTTALPSALPPGGDVDAVLATRLARGHAGPVLRGRTADLRLESPSGCWTIELRDGIARARRGATARTPDTVVRGDADALAALVAGRSSGVTEFLHGRIELRGDMALALQLDGLFLADDPRPEHPRAGVLDLDGIRTAYLEAGAHDAPPVVLLHGLGATNASMLPLLDELSRDHRVLAPDLPGFGASSAPRASYSFAFFASWLQRFQLATGALPAVVIGNSLGGRVALEAGMRQPEDVSGLVLLCPSPAWRRLRHLAPAARLLRPGLPLLRGLPLVPSHQLVVESIRFMFSDPDRLPRSWYDAGADEAVRVMRSPAHRVAFWSTLRSIVSEQSTGDRGFWTRLRKVTPPALFVWGDRDRLVPASFARHVVEALPAAQSVVLEDSGHVPQFEHRERTAELVRRFLEVGPDGRAETPDELDGAAGADYDALPASG